jgi:hypothetical protein
VLPSAVDPIGPIGAVVQTPASGAAAGASNTVLCGGVRCEAGGDPSRDLRSCCCPHASSATVAWLELSDTGRDREPRRGRERDRSAPKGSSGQRGSRGRIPRVGQRPLGNVPGGWRSGDAGASRHASSVAPCPHRGTCSRPVFS